MNIIIGIIVILLFDVLVIAVIPALFQVAKEDVSKKIKENKEKNTIKRQQKYLSIPQKELYSGKNSLLTNLCYNLKFTREQKLASIALISIFGDSCEPSVNNLYRINSTIKLFCECFEISQYEINSYVKENSVSNIINKLKGADKQSLGIIFYAIYVILEVTNTSNAVNYLFEVFKEIGFTKNELLCIINNTGNL